MVLEDNLKRFRQAAGYSQGKEFAQKIGIGYTAYMKYENQGAWPSQETLIKIADALNVTIDALLGHETRDSKTVERQELKALRRVNLALMLAAKDLGLEESL